MGRPRLSFVGLPGAGLIGTLRQELRLQARTVRFRFGVPVTMLIPAVMPFFVWLVLEPATSRVHGPGTYWKAVFDMLPFCAVALSMIVAGSRADLRAGSQMWAVLSAAPVDNTSILFRRACSQVLIAWGASLIPLVVCFGVLYVAGFGVADPLPPLQRWLIQIVPLVTVFVCLWSALVNITGTELGSLILFFFGDGLVRAVLVYILEPLFNTRLILHQDWIGFPEFNQRVRILLRSFDDQRVLDYWGRNFWTTDAAPPWQLLWQEQLPAMAVFIGLAACMLGAAGLFLRRTQGNLKPLVLSDNHPLRTFAKSIHGMRQRYSRDGGLYREPWWALLGLLALCASVLFIHQRQSRFQELSERRYEAETQIADQPWATSQTRLLTWKLTGELTESAIELTARGRLRHDGEEPLARLPFQLNAYLDVEAEVPERRSLTVRRWDRVFIDIDPPLRPGEEIDVVFNMQGSPYEDFLHYNSWHRVDSFATRHEAHLAEEPFSAANDLARSALNPLLLPQRLLLTGTDLMPILRYGTWALTPKPVMPGERGYFVPEPTESPLVPIELDVSLPSGWIVGDACGSLGRNGRLQSTCRAPLDSFALRGGKRAVIEDGDRLFAAALPGHESLMEIHLEGLRRLITLSDRAWPGQEPIDRLIVLEEPPPQLNRSLAQRLWGGFFSPYETVGRTLILAETEVVDGTPLQIDRLVGPLLAGDLLSRRNLDPEQGWIFEKTFGSMMARRMGLVETGAGATMTGKPYEQAYVASPLLKMEERQPFVVRFKAPALWYYIESRVGSGPLFEGIEEFLSQDTEAPGTFEDMLALIERRSNVSLRDIYEDYLIGRALPQLKLENVERRRTENGRWRVTGSVNNHGTGRLRCPLVVSADEEEREIELHLEGAHTDFEVVLDYKPHSVQLDPELTCFRWVTKGRLKLETFSFRGGET